MSDPALDLARLINSNEDFQRRINDFVKAKTEAETAQQQADERIAKAHSVMAALDEKLVSHKRQMAAAQQDHDTAANEAAARIRLLADGQGKLDARTADLDAREQDLAVREKVLAGVKQQFDSALVQLQSIMK